MDTFNTLPFWTKRSFTYAGIGARKTPAIVLAAIRKLAAHLEVKGYTLNSGGAKGADKAFEAGCSLKHIFLASDATDLTREIAWEIHPYPQALSSYPLNLMARNTFQIFGIHLDTPVDFVICWTPDGCELHDNRTRATGGTGQAISMASLKGIPVINLANKGWQDKLLALLK